MLRAVLQFGRRQHNVEHYIRYSLQNQQSDAECANADSQLNKKDLLYDGAALPVGEFHDCATGSPPGLISFSRLSYDILREGFSAMSVQFISRRIVGYVFNAPNEKPDVCIFNSFSDGG